MHAPLESAGESRVEPHSPPLLLRTLRRQQGPLIRSCIDAATEAWEWKIVGSGLTRLEIRSRTGNRRQYRTVRPAGSSSFRMRQYREPDDQTTVSLVSSLNTLITA